MMHDQLNRAGLKAIARALLDRREAVMPATHTPGPWAEHPYNDLIFIQNDRAAHVGAIIATIDVSTSYYTDAQCEANAHLIAAAPNLLRELTLANEWITNLVDALGVSTVIDAMPNNCDGRLGFNAAIEQASP